MSGYDDVLIGYKLFVEANAKAYVDSVVVSIYNDRGTWNASLDTFPSNGGSGAGGGVKKGDVWTVIVSGSPNGMFLDEGDSIRAFIDTPGQVPANWILVPKPSDPVTTVEVEPTPERQYITSADRAFLDDPPAGGGTGNTFMPGGWQ